ncbi:MAG: hypothetical protein QOE14_1612, partial [Humisphaera sp.]|nr:hypothetical protein [Humisphaera sp.]
MSTTATPATAQTEKPVTAKLIAPRPDAVKHLKSACDRGGEIKALRIRNGDDLDDARGQKLQWVADVTDLLNQCFDNVSVADYFNDFVGKVFPEYAEFGNFVEQYYEEMDHRLNKLRAVLKRIEDAAEPTGAVLAAAAGAQVSGTVPAPVEEEGRAARTASAVETNKSSKSRNASPASNRESAMPASAASASSNKVLFVSHGPKDPSSEAVLQFMQQLSMGVVEADHTNGLIETLESQRDMGFVVVMNAADHVENGKATLSENSIFKLGYCAGKLGLKRMCMMNGPTHPNVG